MYNLPPLPKPPPEECSYKIIYHGYLDYFSSEKSNIVLIIKKKKNYKICTKLQHCISLKPKLLDLLNFSYEICFTMEISLSVQANTCIMCITWLCYNLLTDSTESYDNLSPATYRTYNFRKRLRLKNVFSLHEKCAYKIVHHRFSWQGMNSQKIRRLPRSF